MRVLVLIAIVLIAPMPRIALAQPSAAPPIRLTAEEDALLSRGEIPAGAHVGGGFLALVVGLGSGQAVQGRWRERGWIFTLGELGSAALFVYGVSEAVGYACDDCTEDPAPGERAILVGLAGWLVFRFWGTADAFGAPQVHNRKVRELRKRIAGTDANRRVTIAPYVAPAGKNDGAVAGIRLRF